MNGLSGASATPAEDIPVQARIEAAMDTFQEGDRWESIVLFSSEGLPMASQGGAEAYPEGSLLQFGFSLLAAVRLLGEESPVKEIVLHSGGDRMLSFHFFKAWGESVILAAVTTKKRGYHRAVAKLIQTIQKI